MKPQKALHLYQQLEKKNPKLANKGFMILEKHDGWYGYMDLYDGIIMSRQMRAIPSLKYLGDELALTCPPFTRGRLIFEILVEGSPVFKDLNGILNRKSEQATDAYLLVHDFIPLAHESMPFILRHDTAREVVTEYAHPKLRLATVLQGGSAADPEYWHKVAEEVWDRGGEGIILKDLDAPYSPGKRNADIMKIKLENSEEMLVVGAEQGEGKYEGTLGALLVKDQYNVIHRVSGMSDEERHTWWSNLDIIVGKVVEVKFMCRLANGSIREGRFKAVRYDKTKEELG